MSDETWVPPALRYKEIADLATGAAKRMRRHEAEKIAELQDDMPAGRQRVADAEARREEITEAAQERWRAAMEALWDERWMQVTQFPEPDRTTKSTTTDNAVKRVQGAYFALHEALHRSRSWLPTPGRTRRGE